MKTITFNQFQSLCKKTWKTEGKGSNDIKSVHTALLLCEKKCSDNLKKVISSAWKYFKSNP